MTDRLFSILERRQASISGYSINGNTWDARLAFFKCPHCSFGIDEEDESIKRKPFPNKSLKRAITKHIEKTHKLNALHCNLCNYVTTNNSHFANHVVSIHQGKQKFQCSKCEYTCQKESVMKRHELTKHKNLNCPDCEFSTINKKDLQSHRLTTHDFIRKCCNLCGFESATWKGARIHMNRAHGNLKGELQCQKCIFIGSYDEHLKHRHVKDNVVQDTVVSCTLCRFKTRNRTNKRKHPFISLADHMKKQHPGVIKQEKSGKTKISADSNASTSYEREQVMNSASPAKKVVDTCTITHGYTCNECNQSFTNPNQLKGHVAVEHKASAQEQETFSSNKCEGKFADASQMQKHFTESHERGKNYKCEHCDQRFDQNSKKRAHMMTCNSEPTKKFCAEPRHHTLEDELNASLQIQEDLRNELESMKSQYYDCNVTSKQFKQEIELLKTENSKMQSCLLGRERSLLEKSEENQEYLSKNISKDDQIEELKNDLKVALKSWHEQRDTNSSRKEALKKENRDLQSNLLCFERSLLEKSEENQKLIQDNKSKDALLMQSKNELSRALKYRSEKLSSYSNLKHEHEILLLDSENQNSNISALEGDISKFKSEINEWEKKESVFKDASNQKDQIISEMKIDWLQCIQTNGKLQLHLSNSLRKQEDLARKLGLKYYRAKCDNTDVSANVMNGRACSSSPFSSPSTNMTLSNGSTLDDSSHDIPMNEIFDERERLIRYIYVKEKEVTTLESVNTDLESSSKAKSDEINDLRKRIKSKDDQTCTNEIKSQKKLKSLANSYEQVKKENEKYKNVLQNIKADTNDN